MGCNNNKNFNSNIGYEEVLDLNVTYTGCQHECNGFQVLPGMNIRSILDILLSNCGQTPTTQSTNFWFGIGSPTFLTAKEDDYYLQSNGVIWQFQNNSWTNTGITIGGGSVPTDVSWGEITGDINNQSDLLTFIQQNAINPDNVGLNLRVEDNTLLLGQRSEAAESIDAKYVIIAPNIFDPFDPNVTPTPNLYLVDITGLQTANLNAPGDVVVKSNEGNVKLLSGDNEDKILEITPSYLSVRFSDSAVSLNEESLALYKGTSFVRITDILSEIGNNNGELDIDAQGSYLYSKSPNGQIKSGIKASKTPAASGVGNVIIISVYDINNNVESQADFRYATAPNITNPLQIVHKGYVDALEARVADLEARVTAL